MANIDTLSPPLNEMGHISTNEDTLLPTSPPTTPSPPALNSSSYPSLTYYENNPKAKNELIQKATVRLRCRLLQEGLTDVNVKVSHLLSELDNLRIEMATTENVLTKFGEPDDRQLQALERRFNQHQQQLNQLLSSSLSARQDLQTPTPPSSTKKLPANAITASTSFSSTLSRMSSIFSSRQKAKKPSTDSHPIQPACSFSVSSSNTSTSGDGHDDATALSASPSALEAHERRMRRRQRVKLLRQEYQQRLRMYDPNWNEHDDWQNAHSPALSVEHNHNDLHTTSPIIAASKPKAKTATTPAQPPLDSLHESPQEPLQESLQEPSQGKKGKEQPAQRQQQPSTKRSLQQEKQRTQNGKVKAENKRISSAKLPPKSKKGITVSAATSKADPALCLCKRKTNKPHPSKHDRAASTKSRQYHSKQPELKESAVSKRTLPPMPADETTCAKSPIEKQQPEKTAIAASVTAKTANNDKNDSPTKFSVTEWLLHQQQYHQDMSDDSHSANITSHDGNHAFAMKHHHPSLTLENQTKQSHSSNLFEDVLRYLDTISDFGNDAGLEQEISQLLSPTSDQFQHQQQHPSVAPSLSSSLSSSSSCSSISSFSPSSYFVNTYGKSPPSLYMLLANHGIDNCSRYIADCVNKGLSWCKFLSVLSLALLISLRRGPDHMLLSFDDLDSLDLMADQDDFVYSYYL